MSMSHSNSDHVARWEGGKGEEQRSRWIWEQDRSDRGRKREEFRKGCFSFKTEETRVAIDLWTEPGLYFLDYARFGRGDCANIVQRGFLKPNVEFLLR